MDDRAVLSEAQALHVGEAPALGHAHDRQVELLPRHVVDHRGVAERLLRHGRYVAADEADHCVRLGVLDRLRGADVGPEGRRAGVDDDVVVVARDAHRFFHGEVERRRIEQPRAREHPRWVGEPGGVPERPDLALRLVARARPPVEVLVRGRIQEERPHARPSPARRAHASRDSQLWA